MFSFRLAMNCPFHATKCQPNRPRTKLTNVKQYPVDRSSAWRVSHAKTCDESKFLRMACCTQKTINDFLLKTMFGILFTISKMFLRIPLVLNETIS